MAIFIIPLIVWFLGQGVKFLLQVFRYKKLEPKVFFDLGNMPSTHSAMVSSLCTIIGLKYRWNSPLFGIALIFSLIVIHDAFRLRNVLEDHSKILNRLRQRLSTAEQQQHPEVSENIGHNFVEVVAGVIFGIIVTLYLALVL